MIDDLLRGWDGEELVSGSTSRPGTWMLVGVHSTVLGPAMGGTRMKPYPSLEDAVRDALRLSQAMSMKQAAAGLPYGGGKAVLAVPEVPALGSDDRARILDRYAAHRRVLARHLRDCRGHEHGASRHGPDLRRDVTRARPVAGQRRRR